MGMKKVDFKEKQRKEAAKRLKKLTEIFELNPEVVKRFEERQRVVLNDNDENFPEEVYEACTGLANDFMKKNNALVYYMIVQTIPALGIVLNLLYISGDEETWDETADIYEDTILAATKNLNTGFVEYGAIRLAKGKDGELIRIG